MSRRIVDNRIPAGYSVRLYAPGRVTEGGQRLATFQPLREWAPGNEEALYINNRLEIASYVTLTGAVQFAQRFVTRGCQEHLVMDCRWCRAGKRHEHEA